MLAQSFRTTRARPRRCSPRCATGSRSSSRRASIGPFTNGYWGHPAYRLHPEVNLLAFSHYLDALEFQRDYVRIHALLGGKNPHPQTYLVGGMASPLDPNSQNAINDNTLQELAQLVQRGIEFVEQVYLPDLYAIAPAYPEWTRYGKGLGSYLVFGDYTLSAPEKGNPPAGGLFPGGVLVDGEYGPFEPDKVSESAFHSWYRHDDAKPSLPPWQGETTPDYTGPQPPFDQLDVAGKYTWLKGSPLRRPGHGGRPARPHARRTRRRRRAHHPGSRRRAPAARRPCQRADVHARPRARAGPGNPADGRLHAGAGRTGCATMWPAATSPSPTTRSGIPGAGRAAGRWASAFTRRHAAHCRTGW